MALAGQMQAGVASWLEDSPKAWPMAVTFLTGGILVHLLVGGMDQLGYQYGELFKGQLLVLVGVQFLHDVIYATLILILLLWMWERGI